MTKYIQTPSPNFDERDPDQPIDILMLHYTGMQTGAAALDRLCDPEAQVSAHYLVEEDGSVFQLVAESQRAWHAGLGFWRGASNINSRSIGIEIVNPGHEWGYRAFPEDQITSVMSLCQDILSRHDIPARNVIGHSDTAPTRKTDPGELFPWPLLAQNGIGLWTEDDRKDTTNDLENMLSRFGYEMDDLGASLNAFRRHYEPDGLTHQNEAKTRARLGALLDLIGEKT